jgi:hypothetical protein
MTGFEIVENAIKLGIHGHSQAVILEPRAQFDRAVRGYDFYGDRLIYSYDEIIDLLTVKLGCAFSAREHFDYNLSPENHHGEERWPIFLYDDFEVEE